MKRILFIVSVVVCGMACSDIYAQTMSDIDLNSLRKENERLISLHQEQSKEEKPALQPMNLVDLQIPCMNESFDTDEEVRALGVGEGKTMAQAKKNALHVALDEIIWKMPTKIKSRTTFNSDGSYSDETVIESLLTEEQKQIIFNNAQIYCVKYENTKENEYVAYLVVGVSKEKTKFQNQ